ncbi:MAG: hypothetical protein MMC33_009068 [Icmadophila ericetorum]|nr:hypothetical protein [Icmadophila ericetorum]
MGLLDKIHEKIELYKLEQQYTRRKGRMAFTSGASYVNGEYIYSTSDMSTRRTNSGPEQTSKVQTWEVKNEGPNFADDQ